MKIIYTTFILITLGFGSLFATDMNLKELSKYNGKNGQKAYIAIDGKIYDVSNNSKWKDGIHLPTAKNPKENGGPLMAGIDASKIIEYAPHKKSVLKELPVVGNLVK